MPPSRIVDLPFPAKGLNENFGYQDQPELTTVSVLNCRLFDPLLERARGGQRFGTTKWLDQLEDSPVQIIDHLTTGVTDFVRTTVAVAVVNGTIYKIASGVSSVPAGGSSALLTKIDAWSTPGFQKVWFVDGTNYKVFDPALNTVATWTPTAGALPTGSGGTARLIDIYRGRIVMSGLPADPHNWFMSRVGDPMDWDYGNAVITETMPVAGNNSEAGLVGDRINTMIPIGDDVLLFGGDHTVWRMAGDPMSGGRIDLVSDQTGMAWGRPWCKDPIGRIYFFGNKGGVYRMSAAGLPERISNRSIERRLVQVNLEDNLVQMAWDHRMQGALVFITPFDGSATTNYFWDGRSEGWWVDQFPETWMNPTALHNFDGDDPADRAVLMGGQDGTIRFFDPNACQDDYYNIQSHVFIGPVVEDTVNEQFTQKELMGTLANNSGDVTYQVYVGKSTEDASGASTPQFEGTWEAGRNPSDIRRAQAHALYVKLINNDSSCWAMEHASSKVIPSGKARKQIG